MAVYLDRAGQRGRKTAIASEVRPFSAPIVNYRPALRLFITVLMLQLLAVATVNILINPYRLYSSDLVAPIIADDHTLKLGLLWRQRPELLVLGSSRVEKLEPAYLQQRTGLPTFNLGVASGQPEDSLCLFRYATEGLALPVKWVVLGVDVDGFNPTAAVNTRLLKDPRLRGYLPPELRPRWTTTLADLSQALTLDQLQVSYHALQHQLKLLDRGSASASPLQVDHAIRTFDPDGLGHFASERLPLDLTLDMRLCMQRFQNYPSLSPARLRYLDDLARLCRRRGIRLSVFLTTVHTHYARVVAATYWPRYRELVPRLQQMAERDRFSFLDCSTVSKYGGDPNDFYDSSHIMAGNARRIIDRITSDAVQ